ncbi:ChaC-like protein-domain-containing protein [Aspergillus pseudoustus]|uniref:glutathione-specific gamma-glutamylcyclotransferase n=1 Tax=Aspergillus pseudoustus TaxID=1810923 RepID=A0ABR4K6W7_9EURO
MSPTSQETGIQPPANGRTWRQYFPKGDLWVFGYGSLIWKPPPHHDQRVPGYIEGYVRRFWQASTDHRGTPEQPGRVVTVIERGFWETLDDPHAPLEPSSTNRVWGAAYHIPSSHAEEVHDYLDVREIDGYSVHYTPFHPFGSTSSASETASESLAAPITCMVYIGQPSNPQFLRDPAHREPQDVAEVISRGFGQSGKNTEYLYLLEKALEGIGLGSADGHVTDLVRRVRAIEGGVEATREEEKAERDVRLSLTEGAKGDEADLFE